jgi:hypothetical protein
MASGKPGTVQRHSLEVLYNGGEMKLVAGAGETAKAHPLKGVPFSDRAWLRASFGVARDLLERCARTSLLELASVALLRL